VPVEAYWIAFVVVARENSVRKTEEIKSSLAQKDTDEGLHHTR
jgi:hypothetical protein